MYDILGVVMNGGYKLGISHHALDVLKDLCDRANRHDGERLTAFPSHAGMAERTMISKASVKRGIIELQEAGYIVVKHQYNRDGYTTNEYEINEALINQRITAYIKPERKPKEPDLLSHQPVSDNNEPEQATATMVEAEPKERPPLDAIIPDDEFEDDFIDEEPVCEFEEPEAQPLPPGWALDKDGNPFKTVELLMQESEEKERAIDRAEQDTIVHNAVASASYCIAGPEPENYEFFDKKPAVPEQAPAPINRGIRSNIITDSAFPQPVGTTPGWGERVWCGVTKQLCSPGAKRDEIYEVLSLLWPKYNSEAAMIEYLTPFYQAWTSRKGKNGVRYSPTNPVWLTEWVSAGAIPEDAKEQEPAHRSKPQVW